MSEVFFYHLTRQSVDQALPPLLQKCRGAGWRVGVRGRDAGFLDWLDEKLWLGPDDGFLPHGRAGGPHDADQPILLTNGAETDFDCVICVDSADLDPSEVANMKRACVMFDGTNDDAVSAARLQWAALTGAGCAAKYWSEESGNWQLKAEKPGSAPQG